MGEDIAIDILSRLPVKSVKRFKCVSKSWNKLISDSYFKRRHLNHHQAKAKNKVLITHREKQTNSFYSSSLSPRRILKDVQKLDPPSTCVPGDCRIFCCCDGLVLLGTKNCGLKDKIFLLWNPSTRESRLLPQQNTYSSRSNYGLGYDSTSDDYKVFKVMEKTDQVPNEIFSLKSGSWREIDDSSSNRGYASTMISGRDSLAFVHGAFHWLHFICLGSWLSVISFDISNEIYGELLLPEQIFMPEHNMSDIHITVLGGTLSVNCLYGYNSPFLDIWVMKDYGVKESWTKLFSIDMEGINMLSVIPVMPKYIFENGQVLLKCGAIPVFKTSTGSIGLSDLIRPLVSEDIDKDVTAKGGYVYTESLISPEVNH